LSHIFSAILSKLQSGFNELFESIPKPQKIKWLDGYAFRYAERNVEQALILKVARLLSSLYSSRLLLSSGFLQEIGALQRIMDEIDSDILFLCGPILFGNKEQRHDDYLEEFFAEEFDVPSDPVRSTQKRRRVPRDKIRAYNARTYVSSLSVSDVVSVTETIEKAYSGYVHATAVHTFDMFGGEPPRFHVSGIPSLERRDATETDLLNYYFRAIGAMIFVSKAFGKDPLSNQLLEFSREISIQTGIDNWGVGFLR
jgi:hypothetical protein